MPPINRVSILRSCSICNLGIETIQVKKDNMMLSSRELLWCSNCETEQPEYRDIADRMDTIRMEQSSYPLPTLATPFVAPQGR